ncbi:MAG: diguanylate cyclase [Phycisphaerae bacterium]|nr:diguanylate cyclase [Phycisphaerae bacterium]
MPSPDAKPIVLIVDDSVDVHRLLTARLKHEPIELVSATNGVQAVQLAKQRLPATILLDLDMPQMDGLSVLRALKDEPSTRTIPIIVLSGLQSSQDKVTAFELGANDYVTKPFDLAELRARLRASLRLHHLLGLLSDRADLDGLTGLGNRAAFNKRWAQETSGNRRYGTPLSLLIVDIDHFKKINDTYGHPAGDEVLIGFAKLLQKECRETDIPCRYGGEEFALIMPSTSPADAAQVAERIRVAVAGVTWPRHPEHHVTASFGVAGVAQTPCPLSAEAWLEAADKNLYSSKKSGRNRVSTSDLAAAPMAKAG